MKGRLSNVFPVVWVGLICTLKPTPALASETETAPSVYATLQIATNSLDLALLRGDAETALQFLSPNFELGQHQYRHHDMAWLRSALPQQLKLAHFSILKTTISSVVLKGGRATTQSQMRSVAERTDGTRAEIFLSDCSAVWVETKVGWRLQQDETTFNQLLHLVTPPELPLNITRFAPGDAQTVYPTENPFFAWTTSTPEAVTQLVYSPDGATLAIKSSFDGLRLASLATGTAPQAIQVSNRLNFVSYDWEGRLMTSHFNNKVAFWDAKTTTLEQVIPMGGHYRHDVGAIAISLDGHTLAAENFLWDINSRCSPQALEAFWNPAQNLEFSPDGKTLAADFGDGVNLWNVKDGKLIQKISREHWVGFQYDGKFITVSSGRLHFRSTGIDSIERQVSIPTLFLEPETTPKHSPAVSLPEAILAPDGRTLATVYRNGTVGIWDLQTGAIEHLLRGFQSEWAYGDISAMTFSPDSMVLAVANRRGETALWNVSDNISPSR